MKPVAAKCITKILTMGIILHAGLLMAAGSIAGGAASPMSAVSLLLFDEEEPGTGSYPVRYLVNDAYLRIDDGYDASDYILLDRASSIISSISHEHGNILVINRQPPADMPASLKLSRERVPDSDAPPISGKRPQHYRYTANGKLCYEAMVVSGLMQAAVVGLAEYERLLAGQQAAKLENTPVEYRTPCFLSRYIYAPGRHLDQGLPIQVWDTKGFRRALVNYSANENVPQYLFDVPSDYQEITIGEVAE